MAQILLAVHGEDSALRFMADVVANRDKMQEDCVEDCPGCLATLADGAACPLAVYSAEVTSEED